jgi:hypothetical protein
MGHEDILGTMSLYAVWYPCQSILIIPAIIFYRSSVGVSVTPCNANNGGVSSVKEAVRLDDFSLFLLIVFRIVVRSPWDCQYIFSTVLQGSAISLAIGSHIWALCLVKGVSHIEIIRSEIDHTGHTVSQSCPPADHSRFSLTWCNSANNNYPRFSRAILLRFLSSSNPSREVL